MTAVGELLELSYGKALKAGDRSGGPIPVVGSGGVIGHHSVGITGGSTIVVGRKGSIGSVTWIEGSAWPIDTAYFVSPVRKDLDARWIYWMLQSLGLPAMNKSAAVPGLNRDDVYRLDVFVPQFDEQQRIAAILDHADALRAKRRRALAHLDSLTQSVFRDMFGDPDDAPDEVSFGDVATLLAGRNLVHDDAAAASPFRVLKISAVTSGKFRPTESKPLPSGYNPPVAHLVQPGDLLMSRANTAALVGAVAYVRETPANLALPDKVWKFAWHDGRSVPLFYHALFGSPTMRRRISQLASGTGGSMKNISKANLEKLNLPRVDYARQETFADRARIIASAQGEATRALREQSGLIASLQSRAFRGSL